MFTLLDKILKKEEIPDPPYQYDFLINLDEKEYPKYLAKGFFVKTGEILDLKNPKTFNQKIQWLKLYDCSPLKTQLTDKVLVRDWIKNKIGDDYLKPVLWIGRSFDDIPFEKLTDSFIIKTNHGCKWNYRIKNKKGLLENDKLLKMLKNSFDGWMSQTFFPCAGFEMQYKDIKPQIIVEPLLLESLDDKPEELEIYCFNGIPRIFQKIKYSDPREVSVYDENYNQIELKFLPEYKVINEAVDDNLKLAVTLSQKLCEEFKLVRVDWLLYKNKIYFNEMTFTPFSGYYNFENNEWNIKLGNMLNLKDYRR